MRIFVALLLCLINFNCFGLPSIFQLAGSINNQYNIRDDILSYIRSIFPPLSSHAFYAVVKIASNQQALYYNVKSSAEAAKLMTQNYIAKKCLSMERKEDDYEIFKTIERMMANTPDRFIHIMNTCNQFFSKEVIDRPKITKQELINRCNAEDY